MMSNRHSYRFLSSRKKKSSKAKKSRKNNSHSILCNYSSNPKIFISYFDISSSKNKKKGNCSKKNNIIMDNKVSKYSSLINTNISFNDEKSLNSTFFYAGDNCSLYDNSRVFNNYLKVEQKQFDLIPQIEKNNSFSEDNSLASLVNSLCSQKKTSVDNKNKFNEKLIEMIKKNNNNMKQEKKHNSELVKNNKTNKKNKKVKHTHDRQRKNKYYSIALILLNLFIYIILFSKIFEPSVKKLFFDNDHGNYIYKTSLLSKDTCITINK